MTAETPWSETVVAGSILLVLGLFLTGLLIPGVLSIIVGLVFFFVGVVVSRRSTYLLRDFLAYVLFTFASLSATFNLVELALGRSAIFGPDSAPFVLASIVAALAAGLVLLTVLRRWKRVPQFG